MMEALREQNYENIAFYSFIIILSFPAIVKNHVRGYFVILKTYRIFYLTK